MGCGVEVPPAFVRVPSQRPLAPSVASVTSVTNDKVDNEMILGAVHRSPGICLTAKENPRFISQETIWWRVCATSYCLKWGPFPTNGVSSIALHIRKGAGRKEGWGLGVIGRDPYSYMYRYSTQIYLVITCTLCSFLYFLHIMLLVSRSMVLCKTIYISY